MSTEDKARNAAQKTKGKSKEVAGKVTGDRELENEGRADLAGADVKQAAENVKDATKR